MDSLIGQTLISRYRIMELIGEGGMALVYKANDLLLNRIVAVKVLRPQFASDAQFVERFRREAQAAASLSHPNVVNIYDVGQDGGIYFIVMEFVQGRDLKTIMREDPATFTVKKVVDIAIQICRALEHAHAKNVIHRDIKPHNILITDDGVVKVTDFGIARAVSSATLTQTGMIIGSVHYFSPEQAKGANIGPQSDLYSLGVVLFELLTGQLPYSGDTPIAIALKHAQGDVPSLRKINPAVPVFLEKIVRTAMAKNLRERYQSARELRQDLERVVWRESDRAAAPVAPELEQTKVLNRSSIVQEETKVARKNSVWKKLFLFIAFIGLAGATFLFVVYPSLFNVDEVMVPRIIGMSLSEAQQTLERVGLSLHVQRRVFDNNVPKDHIIEQDPRPNRWIKVNRKVEVIVSMGPELVSVPDIVGLTPREARVALSSAGLVYGTELTDFSSSIPEGSIMLQDPPAFSRVEKGTSVTVTLSRGIAPATVVVPNFIGRPYAEALSELRSIGLVPGRVISDARAGQGRAPGIVLDHNPPAGVAIPPGSSVDFVISPEQAAGPGTQPEQPQQPSPDVPAEPTLPGAELPAGPEQPVEPEIPQTFEPEPTPEPEPEPETPADEPIVSPADQVKRAEVQILVPPGPINQLVQIIVIDSYPAREVYSRTHRPGDRIVQIVEGYGPSVKLQVYIDGVMYKEQSFRD